MNIFTQNQINICVHRNFFGVIKGYLTTINCMDYITLIGSVIKIYLIIKVDLFQTIRKFITHSSVSYSTAGWKAMTFYNCAIANMHFICVIISLYCIKTNFYYYCESPLNNWCKNLELRNFYVAALCLCTTTSYLNFVISSISAINVYFSIIKKKLHFTSFAFTIRALIKFKMWSCYHFHFHIFN